MHKWFVAIIGAFGISGCGSDESKPIGAITSLPASLEGRLSIDVMNDAGSFGTLVVGDTRYLVAIPAPVFAASGASPGGGAVWVTIDAKEAEYAPGVATYRVAEMKKL